MEQATLSPPSLANRLASLFGDPATLQAAAVAAKSLGQPRAVEQLADLTEAAARGTDK
jgi:UDP-N-acetylglucosamine--N-acetylmuramyl-(pentapeptide) pyrophosphoryl-undecaprenol N-acetylglucosamine transferase